ncbi:hypothetical protein BDW02DRAFT_274693 [Decorospora gaudefroyi]|uniref:Uncharacterized protein n=1 Tax=Decorospora gaudefroyi TaxID=184978 RepID=A0A6A5KS78_9PLEO|nr:hypothetical protein BDW02DRAFT_274693 [Decorospora gaudefroyi]
MQERKSFDMQHLTFESCHAMTNHAYLYLEETITITCARHGMEHQCRICLTVTAISRVGVAMLFPHSSKSNPSGTTSSQSYVTLMTCLVAAWKKKVTWGQHPLTGLVMRGSATQLRLWSYHHGAFSRGGEEVRKRCAKIEGSCWFLHSGARRGTKGCQVYMSSLEHRGRRKMLAIAETVQEHLILYECND